MKTLMSFRNFEIRSLSDMTSYPPEPEAEMEMEVKFR